MSAAENNPPELRACPYCGEPDYDLIGLKSHLTKGECEAFETIESIRSPMDSLRAPASPKPVDLCDVCLGKPLESGASCICGGRGTSMEEKVGLRVAIYKLKSDNELLAKVAKNLEGQLVDSQNAYDCACKTEQLYKQGNEQLRTQLEEIKQQFSDYQLKHPDIYDDSAATERSEGK